jgi:acetylornithine deacetylase/succinyl-diaminopimelate desuccinylase-like protein
MLIRPPSATLESWTRWQREQPGMASHAKRIVSRAYHDSLFMARIAPVAMLFIPCQGGASHCPEEYASPQAITNGTLVLAEALAELASS